ncbi:MAG: hypothetical protein H0U74_18805 [Bradymonadaceae bacterium]|nr:hypothetical protein [Lujinxingiaceae bacterium]
MSLCFWFTDAPRLSDVWKTNLDIDVMIHTRPPLLVQRDRFARTYGTRHAEQALQNCVIRGLKAYGYATFESLYESLYDGLERLTCEALADMIIAFNAFDESPESVQMFAERERILFDEILDIPEMVVYFVDNLLLRLSLLDPLERMRELYGLRGARLGHDVPFSKNAPEMLARAFGSEEIIPQLRRADSSPPKKASLGEQAEDDSIALEEPGAKLPTIPTIKSLDLRKLHDDLFADVMAGLIERLDEHPQFVDTLLEHWVVPRLDERFEEVDAHIEEMREMFTSRGISREEFICRMKASPEWLALASELGAPVPEPDPPQA